MEKSDTTKNKDTTAIFICAGEATRWGNHLGTPKHLIEIEGEPILHRAVRLLKERGVEKIYIVTKEIKPEYHAEGAIQAVARLNPDNVDADKFLSSSHLWSNKGRTIVFYGDCYFTEDAMDTILGHSKKEWTLFCRPEASQVTGTPYGECFAQSFYLEHQARHEDMLHYIADLYKRGIISRCGGWEHYRAMTGRTGAKVRRPHRMTTNYVEINDWTEDFDTPEDYEAWIANRKAKVL